VGISGLDRLPKTVFTVHNIAYQGFFGRDQLPTTGLPWDLFTPEGIEFYGDLNLLKAGFRYADHITTVSERYAAEIMTPEYGCGMESIVLASRDRLSGILSGVDYEIWCPEKDEHLRAVYSLHDLSGKEICKAALQDEMGLPKEAEIPLLVTVSPHDIQKGVALISDELEVLLLGNEIQLALLGEKDPESDRLAQDLQSRFPHQVAVRKGCEERMAHWIAAGADLCLIPARCTPCGLTQLTSLKYGTPPVLRQAGAMSDAIRDYNEAQKDGYGFVFHNQDSKDLLHAVRRALSVYRDKTAWTALQRRGMACDFSWKTSAGKYENLYQHLLEEATP
jgi:starch synthase